MRVARHFGAGKEAGKKIGVPERRLKMRSTLFSRPSGTLIVSRLVPSTEVPGYFRSSLTGLSSLLLRELHRLHVGGLGEERVGDGAVELDGVRVDACRWHA